MKKTMIVFFLLILSFLLISCENVSSIEIRGITQLEVGYAEEYKIFENDSENNVNDYYWTTSNREVALCDNNKIMPLKEGNCEIVAVKKNNGEKYATLSISVIDSNIKKIEINGKDTVYVDDYIDLNYLIDPEEAAVDLEWTSSDESIAIVDSEGSVFGLKKGKVEITLSCGRIRTSKTITVKEKVTEVKAEFDLNLVAGQGVEMVFNIEDPVITIKSGSEDKIELIDNILFAKEEGTAQISVKSAAKPSLLKVFEITISKNDVNVDGLTRVNENELEANKIIGKLSTSQKVGQIILTSTSAEDLREDADGIYYNDSSTGVNRKVYVSEKWGGKEISNFIYDNINARDPLNSLNFIQKIAVSNSQIGPFNMMTDSSASALSIFSKQISNRGLGKLSKDQFVKYQTNYAKQLRELGINVYYTYGFDNTLGANSFSDDIVLNNYYSLLMINAFKKEGIMVGIAFEHASNTLNYYEIEKNIITQMANNNIDMIGVIENIENFNGDESIIQYLRNDLKYNGLVYLYSDSTYFYDGVFEGIPTIVPGPQSEMSEAIKAINDGADLLYASLSINYRTWYGGNNDGAIAMFDDVFSQIEAKKISEDKINATISRIVNLKLEYDMIDMTSVGDELSDYTEYINYVNSLYKKTYEISTDFSQLDPTKKTTIINQSYTDGQYPNRTTYNFGKTLQSKLNSSGFENVVLKSDLGSSYQKTFDGIKSGEQAVLYIRNAYYSYSYKEEVNNKTVTRYGSFDWAEIIRQLNEKGVIVIAVVENDKEFYDSINTTNKIFLDGNYDTTYAQAIDIVVKGKETK